MTVKFEMEKDTKNTIRFKEIGDGPLYVNKIGVIYIPKSTLAELGYKAGQLLEVSVDVK